MRGKTREASSPVDYDQIHHDQIDCDQTDYDPPVFHGTPGPKRASSVASSAQAVTRARNEMTSITV